MAIDGIFCSRLAAELKNALIGAKIEKINQTGDEELTLKLYGGGTKYNLLLSASRKNARVCLCGEVPPQNPVPTSFCMLLRKHLQNGRITDVFAPTGERIVCFDVESKDELGYACHRRIYAELMGKYSNLLISDTDKDRVLGALYQTDLTFAARTVLVGLPYEAPPKQDKVLPYGVEKARFAELCEGAPLRECGDFILKTFACFSPLTAREVAYRAGALGKNVADADTDALYGAFTELVFGEGCPCTVYDDKGEQIAFSYTELKQYGDKARAERSESLSALLCTYFEEKGKKEKHDRHSSDLLRLVSNLKERVLKKLGLQTESLKECQRKEEFKRKGDAIIASIYMLKQGMESARLIDYETGEEIEIELDKRKTPANNAKAYYKKYTKLKNAETAMTEQLAKTKLEFEYMESVADAVARAESDSEFDDLRQELERAGYIRGKSRAKAKLKAKPFVYEVDGGYTLKVGKNNLQNDELTFSADKGDIWFHVKNAPGSHAVLYAGGEEPSALAYTQAAQLAAYHSSVSGSPSVAVDYTRVRFVKKPSGAAPGYVIYTHYYTAYVDATNPFQ